METMTPRNPSSRTMRFVPLPTKKYGDTLGTHHGDEFPQLGHTLRENERVGPPPHADGGVAVHALVEEHLARGEFLQIFFSIPSRAA